MRVGTNIHALTSVVNLNSTAKSQGNALRRLSSGLRLNSAQDDAAGYAISHKMALQIKGLQTASKNSLDGVSLIQTADGALDQMHAMLQRMRELAVKAANGVNQIEDKKTMQEEVDQLTSEINRMRETTEFNTVKVFKNKEEDGRYKPTMNLKVQVGEGANHLLNIDFDEISAFKLGISGEAGKDASEHNDPSDPDYDPTDPFHNVKYATVSGLTDFHKDAKDAMGNLIAKEAALDLTDSKNASGAIAAYDRAIEKVSNLRSQLGAVQNRLEKNIANLDSSAENLTQSMSRIQDADMAEEITKFTTFNILQQSGTSMLAQANQLPQQIMKLLER